MLRQRILSRLFAGDKFLQQESTGFLRARVERRGMGRRERTVEGAGGKTSISTSPLASANAPQRSVRQAQAQEQGLVQYARRMTGEAQLGRRGVGAVALSSAKTTQSHSQRRDKAQTRRGVRAQPLLAAPRRERREDTRRRRAPNVLEAPRPRVRRGRSLARVALRARPRGRPRARGTPVSTHARADQARQQAENGRKRGGDRILKQ